VGFGGCPRLRGLSLCSGGVMGRLILPLTSFLCCKVPGEQKEDVLGYAYTDRVLNVDCMIQIKLRYKYFFSLTQDVADDCDGTQPQIFVKYHKAVFKVKKKNVTLVLNLAVSTRIMVL
jgi:hypothetical protein